MSEIDRIREWAVRQRPKLPVAEALGGDLVDHIRHVDVLLSEIDRLEREREDHLWLIGYMATIDPQSMLPPRLMPVVDQAILQLDMGRFTLAEVREYTERKETT